MNIEISLLEDFFLLWWELNYWTILFCLMISFVSFCVFNWARTYMSNSFKLTLFYYVFLTFVLSMLLLSLRNRFLLVFLGWEGLGVSSFILVVFYQTWSSVKGGLLTLLTNRLGDAIFMLVLTYWLILESVNITIRIGNFFLMSFSILAFTKRAQWPFFSWLPAAIAAPTPVSALVHSSTLVTAGVWILIRFNINTIILLNIVIAVGVATLFIARLSALIEKDIKKVVALSTLSQLGLIIFSLGTRTFWGFLHIITHALAKANLFIIVGTFMNNFYSEQDIRSISNYRAFFLNVCMFLVIFSLVGLVFSSMFFTKEAIFLKKSLTSNRLFIFVVVVGLSSLTMAYCVKFYTTFSRLKKNAFTIITTKKRTHSSLFTTILTLSGIFLGWFIIFNRTFVEIRCFSVNNYYWLLPFIGLFFTSPTQHLINFLSKRFSLIILNIYKLECVLFLVKTFSAAEKVLELNYKLISLKMAMNIKQPFRFAIFMAIFMIFFILL